MERGTDERRWTLSPEALGRFLLLLDADVVSAGQKYERLRQKLIRIFEWRGCVFAEDLADETINRVVRRIEEGAEVVAEEIYRYAAAVAHRVHLEHLRERKRAEPRPGDAAGPPWLPGRHETTSLRLVCLETVLDRLPPKERSLLVRYYTGERGARIRNRRRLAGELGLSPENLRIRAYRLRARLEALIQDELGERTGSTSRDAEP
jgi:RNA polymerase sigma factor (sigma-70 family)